jgi:hypothetical protein
MAMRFCCVVFLYLTTVLSPSSVVACSCARLPPPEPGAAPYLVERTPNPDEAIFEGTVTNAQLKGSFFDANVGDLVSADLDGESPFMLISFDISRSYSGRQSKTLQLRTGLGGGDCGYPFEVGKQYLVYAFKNESGEFSTGICSPTGPLEDSKGVIASLRGDRVISTDPEPRVPATRLCGHIVKNNQASSTENRILLISVGNKSPVPSDEAQVSDDCSFCATNVSPGEYYLLYVGGSEEAPTSFGYFPGVAKFSEAETVALKSGQQIENLLLKVPIQASYSVSGTVAAFDKSFADLQPKVALLRAGQIFLGLNYRQDLSPNGSFTFPNVLPGKYWAIVMVETGENSKWFTKKVEVDVDNNVSGLSLTLTQK